MTIDHWLAIAVIISTLIAPLMPALVRWATKPRAKPETNQPKARTHWLIRLGQSSFAFPLLFVILPNAFVLYYYDLRRPVPLTVRVVTDICVHVVAIGYGFFLIFINKIVSIVEKQQALIAGLIDSVDALAKSSKPAKRHEKGKNSN